MVVANKNFVLPSLKLTKAQREADDNRALKLLTDHYISKADAHRANNDIGRLRRLANNEIVDADYESMLNKYNYHKLNKKKAEGYVKSIPLISTVVRMLKGEKRIAPLNYQTKVNNEDVESKYMAERNDKLNELLDQNFINALNDAGFITNIASEAQPPIAEAIQKHEATWQDRRAMAGAEILDGVIEEKFIKEKFYSSYCDWIETAECYSMKDVAKDDLIFRPVRPEDCYVEFSAHSPYAEDGQAAVISQEWNISDVIRMFGDQLSNMSIGDVKKDKKRVDALSWLSQLVGLDGHGDPRPRHMMKDETFESAEQFYKKVVGHSRGLAERTIPVHHCMFNLVTPYKLLTYNDEFGIEHIEEVTDEYVVNKDAGDISAERLWRNEVYHTWKIGNDTSEGYYGIYPVIEALYPQRAEINNSSTGKLPINGRADGLSVPKVLEEFQYKYNLVHLIEENTLGKNGNKPIILPISVVPSDASWGKTPLDRAETLLYYRDTFNVILVDDSKMNPHLAQLMKAVDMSTLDAVEKFVRLKENIKADAWDAIGVNRQRQGETYSSDGKATNEQALIRSSIMTADFNIAYNNLEGVDLLGILDYSKVAYVNGKTFTRYPNRSDYYVSDKTKAMYSLDVDEHIESSYGVTVAVAHLDQDKLNVIQPLGQSLLQNNVSAHHAYKALTSSNPVKAEDYLKTAYEVATAYDKQVADAERASNEKIASDNLAAQQASNQNALDIQALKNEVDLYKIDVDKYLKAAEGGDVTAEAFKQAIENRQLSIKQQEVNIANKKVNNDYKLGKEANKIAKANKASTNK